MEFAAPWYFVLLILAPALAGLFVHAFRRKRETIAAFGDIALLIRQPPGVRPPWPWLKAFCLIAAVISMTLALARPQWGKSAEEVPRQGRDLFILLDVSLSMLAEDAAPNRLEHAKAAINALVDTLEDEGGHRLGLIAFAGRASLQCPLTLDFTFFRQRLHDVGPDSAARKGSRIGDAIEQALQGFGAIDPTYTDLILISDGEDHNSLAHEAARAAAALGVEIYTVGVGDPNRGSPIPLADAQGRRTNIQFQGEEVRSLMHQDLLLEIAQLANGAYYAAATGPIDLTRLYRDHIADKARRALDSGADERPAQRFQWFVLAALVLLALEMLVRERASQPTESTP